MTGSIAARRYAQALFSLQKKSGLAALDQCAGDLGALAAVAEGSFELSHLFRNPGFSPREKEAVLGQLAEKLSISPVVIQFCRLLTEKGRLEALSAIARCFGSLLDAEKGVKRGEFITAVPLDEKKQADILAALEKKSGSRLSLEFKVNPAVLGGMLVKIGDNVLDASLKAQLSLLKDIITRG
jgi:F-type H+-transporting ATPase subunit delta